MSAVAILRTVLAAALGVGCAVLVACGGSNAHLIPQGAASTIEQQLTSLNAQVAEGQCVSAGGDLDRLNKAVANLPSSVDVALRRTLTKGVRNLNQIAPAECQGKDTVVLTTPVVTTDTTATVQTAETTPTEPTTPETTPTTPETTPTTPPNTTTENRQDTLPDEPPPSDQTGGATAP